MLSNHDKNELRTLLGLRIRSLRRLNDYTQSELSVRVGMDRSCLSRVEKGKRSLTFDELVDIADELGIPLDILVADVVDKREAARPQANRYVCYL